MSTNIGEWLVAQWTSRFGEILLTMGDLQPQMHVQHAADTGIEDGLWWEQPLSCCSDGPIWTGAAEATWKSIGKLVLEAAGVDSAPESEVQSTFLEIVRQAMSSLGTDIGQRISSQVTCEKGSQTAPRKTGREVFRVEVELPTQTVELFLVISDELPRAISAAEAPSQQLTPMQGPQQSMSSDGSLGSRTFELLLDVEMPVSVSFGRATLKLQEALKLITGSMIELDRGLNDPVELLVNNCVIARGEVVVIEGNYGVRITEIVSQKERLQQSRRYMLQ